MTRANVFTELKKHLLKNSHYGAAVAHKLHAGLQINWTSVDPALGHVVKIKSLDPSSLLAQFSLTATKKEN